MRLQRHNRRALVWLLCGVALLSACAHKKAYKAAVKYEKSGRYADAARKDLEALDKKPDYEDALMHLRQIALLAYQELLNQAETFESSSQWVEAVYSYDDLETILRRLQRHNVVLQTIDVPSRMAQAREKGAAYYYGNAERHLGAGEYEPAIEQYKKVTVVAGQYRDTKEKLWQAYTGLGDRELKSQQFQPAISDYEQALTYATNVETTKRQIAEAYYRWAEQLEANRNYREAMAKFEQVLAVVPDYEDAARRAQQAYEKAVRRVAILPFRNRSEYGGQYGYLLTEELITKCINANLKFAVFIDRTNLDRIFDEHKLAQAGAVDEGKAVEIGKLEGLHSFVTGTITQISVVTTRPEFVENTHEKVYTVTDTAGQKIEKREPIYYREYTSQRTVQVAASYQIVDVETGRYLGGESFSEKTADTAQWIRYQGSVRDLPKDKQKLLDASGEPKSADLMINDVVRLIADKMSTNVLRFYR
jgi:tetratricopeptide (TPR) repeat protein